MPLLRIPFLDRSPRRGRGGRIQFVGGGAGSSGPSGPSSPSERSGGFLLVVLAISIGLGILHNKWRSQRRNDPVLAGVHALTYPFQSSGMVMEGGLFQSWKIIFRGRELEAENARLRTTVAALQVENESLKNKAAEGDRLLPAVGLMRVKGNPPLAAPILALLPTPLSDTITVARGTRDGIHRQSIARTAAGLIGQVTDTGPMTSEVMLLTDVNSAVSALVRRKGVSLGIIGIVQGEGRGRNLQLEDLKADVQVGDEVVSSGYGGVFPPDVPIGTIVEVKPNANALLLKSATVAPATGMPGDLREVYLLRP